MEYNACPLYPPVVGAEDEARSTFGDFPHVQIPSFFCLLDPAHSAGT